NYVNWAQEMYDQGGMVRELVKWDYEMRQPAQVQTVVDRALAITHSAPQGPVYLTLPREVLAASVEPTATEDTYIAPATTPSPSAANIEQLAQLIRGAKRPLIITADLGRNEAAF